MKTEELAELMLAYLYEKAEAEVHSFFFFPLNEFANLAGITDDAVVLEAARSLEDRGFIMLSLDMLGQTSALINLEGNCFVESGGETGIIPRYQENPRAFLKEEESVPSWLNAPETDIVQFSPEMMASTAPAQSPPAQSPAVSFDEAEPTGRKACILAIINAILDEVSIDDVLRADLLRDAETLNIQLSKTTRNKAVVTLLMAELSSYPFLAPLVADLSSYT